MAIPSTHWTSVGDLDVLLRPEGLRDMLLESGLPLLSCERTYLRLKPGVGALLGLSLNLRNDDGLEVRLPGYIRTQSRERTAELADKWHAKRAIPTHVGAGIRSLAGGRSLLFLFPNDTRVRGMRLVADKDKLKRILATLPAFGGEGWRVRARKTTTTTVRYKPERRLIMHAALGLKNDRTGELRSQEVFLRFFADDRAAEIENLARTLKDQPIGAHIPRPIGSGSEGRLFVEEAIAGEEILASVLDGSADPAELARVLGLLHASHLQGPRTIDTREVLGAAREVGGNLALVDEACAVQVQRILERLERLCPEGGPLATLHGDCHLHQVLVAAGSQFLIDFERVARGHPLLDLGHLSAHLEILAERETDRRNVVMGFHDNLIASYARANPDVSIEDLPFFKACGLMERALLPFRHLDVSWRQDCLQRLDLALDCVSSGATIRPGSTVTGLPGSRIEGDVVGATWEVFYPRQAAIWPGFVSDAEGQRVFGWWDRDGGRFQRQDPAQDAALPGLQVWLQRGELRSYRVGRRALVSARIDKEDLCVKVVRPRKLRDLSRRHHAAKAAAEGAGAAFPLTPRVVAEDSSLGSLTLEQLAGHSLHGMLMDSPDEADAALTRTGQALAAFHAVRVEHLDLPPTGETRPLSMWANFVSQHDDALADECAGTLAALSTLPNGPFGPADRLRHGDLHDKNILVSPDRVALLDLDGLSLGDSVEDLGNLAAHLVLRALQRGDAPLTGREQAGTLINAYREHGASACSDAVTAVAARTLFRLACIYRFRRIWLDLPRALLEEARRCTETNLTP